MPATVSGTIDTVRLRVDHSSLTDTQVLDLVNNAHREMQREYPITWQEAVTQSTIATATGVLQSFSLPTDMKAPTRMYVLISGEHRQVRYKAEFFDLITEYAGATSATRPSWWSQYGGVGYFFPLLSSSLTSELYYTRILPDYTSVTGSDDILNRVPEALEYAAIAEYYLNLGEAKKAEPYYVRVAGSIRKILKQHRGEKERIRDMRPVTPGTIVRNSREPS